MGVIDAFLREFGADAIAFVDFMFRQNRVALLMPEQRALRNDERVLRRRYSLKRNGATVRTRQGYFAPKKQSAR